MKYIIDNKTYLFCFDIYSNEVYKNSFNELVCEIFGFDFNFWDQLGYWDEAYKPHVLVIDNQVVANVSVNFLSFNIGDETKHYIQLGTVMTKKAYRHKGLSQFLMNQVLDMYQDQCDGIYLYANPSVTAFYPKFGFIPKNESIAISHSIQSKNDYMKIDLSNVEHLTLLKSFMTSEVFTHSEIGLTRIENLFMFYTLQFYRNHIRYSKAFDSIVICEVEDDVLTYFQVLSKQTCQLNDVIASVMDASIKTVKLGFTPLEDASFKFELLVEQDSQFFWHSSKPYLIKGMFPLFSRT